MVVGTATKGHSRVASTVRRASSLRMGEAPSSADRELFSVAPMMAHTHRHYRYFFRKLSRKSHLYTEMIPAAQIVASYERARSSLKLGSREEADQYDAEEIMEVVYQMQVAGEGDGYSSLNQMLRLSGEEEHPVALQLGGRDPQKLAKASAIGAAFGYDSINLNCGCPSSAVGGRSGGASLMREPSHVAKCVEAMSAAVAEMSHATSRNAAKISVKHRLGVQEAGVYDADADRRKNDDEAFATCSNFVRTITRNSDVSLLHVHARLGLLGDFDASPESSSSETSLWVPGGKVNVVIDGKIDHKREQIQAKRRSRLATIQNRSVPPLRPQVVNMLASEFLDLQFVTNGGIKSLQDIRERLSKSHVDAAGGVATGAMVGRAVINHPCAFASVDSLWEDHVMLPKPSRGEVLIDYIAYCDEEEERALILGALPTSMGSLRRRLVAVVFNLFSGEDGNDTFQRRIRKMAGRAERHTARSILTAALFEVPDESANKAVDEHASMDEIKVYDFTRRSGPLQRSIF
jgi:tRNA-dihydrouridine synthase A